MVAKPRLRITVLHNIQAQSDSPGACSVLKGHQRRTKREEQRPVGIGVSALPSTCLLYQMRLYVCAWTCRHWNVFSKHRVCKIRKTLHNPHDALYRCGVGHTTNTVDWFSQLLLALLLKASIPKQLSFCNIYFFISQTWNIYFLLKWALLRTKCCRSITSFRKICLSRSWRRATTKEPIILLIKIFNWGKFFRSTETQCLWSRK